MSQVGDCYDNAVVESFFKSLKGESNIENRSLNRDETRSVLFEYIEVFYNRQVKGVKSLLGYMLDLVHARSQEET